MLIAVCEVAIAARQLTSQHASGLSSHFAFLFYAMIASCRDSEQSPSSALRFFCFFVPHTPSALNYH